MADPVIYNAEAFDEASLGSSLTTVGNLDKYYPAPPFSGNSATGQFGRGTSPQGWATQGNPGVSWGFPLPVATATCGQTLAFCQGGSFGLSEICSFWDGLNLATCTIPLIVYTDATGHIVAASLTSRSASPVVYGTSSNALAPGTGGGFYNSVEVCLKVHATTGTIEIKVDGTDWLNLSGLNTIPFGGTANVAVAFLGSFHSGLSAEGRQYTDWVVHDGTAFLGDVRVSYFPANATGTYTAGTPTGGTAVQCVSDVHGESESTDYIDFDNTSLPKAASFHVQPLPSNVVAVKAVVPRGVAEKSDAGPTQGRMLFISGGTETDGGADLILPTNWRIFERVYQTDPNTSAAWTIANANAVEAGFRRTV